jgi:hypothetical protein
MEWKQYKTTSNKQELFDMDKEIKRLEFNTKMSSLMFIIFNLENPKYI